MREGMFQSVACFRLFKRALAKLNHHLGVSVRQTYLYRLSNADESPVAASTEPRVNWELLTPAGVGRLRELGAFDVNEGIERLERGDRCYTVSIDGRLAHYSWVQRSAMHPITEAGLSVPVREHELWIYHCVTAEWARGRRIYPATLQRIISDCFAEGDSTAWIYTSTDNRASQNGILRAGFGMVATLEALRLGSHYFHLSRAATSREVPATTELAAQLNGFWPLSKNPTRYS